MIYRITLCILKVKLWIYSPKNNIWDLFHFIKIVFYSYFHGNKKILLFINLYHNMNISHIIDKLCIFYDYIGMCKRLKEPSIKNYFYYVIGQAKKIFMWSIKKYIKYELNISIFFLKLISIWKLIKIFIWDYLWL